VNDEPPIATPEPPGHYEEREDGWSVFVPDYPDTLEVDGEPES
jgi:hypothetical protein